MSIAISTAGNRDANVAGGQSLLDLIGNTPLIRLTRATREVGHVEIYAKAEWHNPGGSVKDRAALNMILEGERKGYLRPGKVILDATSGNTGIAYAMIGAAKGYRVKLCVPANVTIERQRILRALGVDLILTNPLESSDGAIREAQRLFRADPASYFYPDQYNNDDNWRAHYNSTGPEIWEQTSGRITHFVAGLGTSGTFTGTARRLKALSPTVQAISVQPDSAFHGLDGLKHMASAIVPGIYEPGLADQSLTVTTDEAHTMVKRLAAEEGILVGVSSGAALACSVNLAKTLNSGVIVTIFPDGGGNYLSEKFWEESS